MIRCVHQQQELANAVEGVFVELSTRMETWTSGGVYAVFWRGLLARYSCGGTHVLRWTYYTSLSALFWSLHQGR